jgi:hypothetical protein
VKCIFRLLEGDLYVAHKDYVRRQIIYCLLQVRYSYTRIIE